ncbi:MAG: hypothetical protein JXA21_14890 [Anaerolineae bacterium]|nr:hypothetical protein [Anaerolineae bacterium]
MDAPSPLNARERERERLARLLNAWLEPSLNMLLAQIGAYQNAGAAPATLNTLSEMASRALADLRDITDDLSPGDLHDLGLVPAIESLALRIESRYGLAVTLDVAGAPAPLSPHLSPALYRVAQQALHNAGQHAGAGRVGISLNHSTQNVRLTIADDGNGFHPPEPLNALAVEGKYGLAEMVEWTTATGGEIAVSSVPGVGTQVLVVLPRVLPEPGALARPGQDDAEFPRELEALTPREQAVLAGVTAGLTNKQIAVQLGISDRTVQFHLGNVLNKLGVASRTEAAVLALQRGLTLER